MKKKRIRRKYIDWEKYINCHHRFTGKPSRKNALIIDDKGKKVGMGYTAYCIYCMLDHPDYMFRSRDRKKL